MALELEALDGPVDTDEYPTPSQYAYEDYDLYDDTGEEPKKIMIGKVKVVSSVDMTNGDCGFALKLHSKNGKLNELLIPAAKLDAGSVYIELQKRHISVLNKIAVLKFIMAMITEIAGMPPRKEIRAIGWDGNFGSFFTGDLLLTGANSLPDGFFWQPLTGQLHRMRQKGTLQEWKDHVGIHVEANPIALALTCLSLSSVLLPLAEQGTGVFNLCGLKGTGKTLCLQMAASIWGNGCDPSLATSQTPAYIAKADSSANGLEALLPTYGVLPAILDELTERDPKGLDTLCYGLASGKGKHRMTSAGGLLESGQWQLNILMSSEAAIADMIAGTGKTMLGGQADRAADIPLPLTGIFTDLGEFDSITELFGHLKSATASYYGTAGLTFLEYCLENPEYVQDALEALPDIVAELLPVGCGDGERRVIMRFALGAIAGGLAAAAGIISDDNGEVQSAFENVRDLWWNRRADSLSLVAGLLRSGAVKCIDSAPKMGQAGSPVVFRHDGLLTFHVDVFEYLVINHKDVIKELDTLGILKREQSSRLKHRYCNNRFFGYSLIADRIDEMLAPQAPSKMDVIEEVA